jgi:hypothetical protein
MTPPRVEFPIPDFDAITVAFGANEKDYLTREQLGDWYGFPGTPYHKAAQGLFYKGGKLADYGLALKPEIDAAKAMNAIRALLGSWAPKHEVKIGTVAVALHQWCHPNQEG